MAAKKKARAAKKKVAKSPARRSTKPKRRTIATNVARDAVEAVASLATKEPVFTKSQWAILFVLAFIQFMHIVDFMVLMPLAKKFEEQFHISTNQFGWLVSSYTLTAFFAGIVGTFFIDRISRKKSLLVAFAGFILGNALCAFAPDYKSFLAARVLTGLFGGLLQGISFSIIGDIIEPSKRGRATGVMMVAFSFAAVIGVPTGIWLSNHFFLQMPYLTIAIGSVLVFAYAQWRLPALTNHLFGPRHNVLRQIQSVFQEAKHLRLFLLMVCHFIAAFSIIPYIAPFMQKNHGVTDAQLPFIYLIGGLATIVSSPVAGWLTDKIGSVRTYTIISALASLPFLLVTNEITRSFPLLLIFAVIFFIFVSGRMVPAMALVNNEVNPSVRGTFMSLNGSVQQLAMSLGAISASFIIVAPAGKPMQHYMWVGIFGCIFNVAAILMANTFRNKK